MRHGKKFNHLGRKAAHRKAMLANMANSLIEHKRINTTVAKAKALKVYVEPLLTKAKTDSTHSRRVVFSYLQNKYAVTELFREIAPKIGDRPGGYTRILKTGNRLGDNAEMCFIELVDFNDTYTTEKKKAAKKTRRRGGSSKVKAETKTTKEAPKAEEVPAVEDAVVVEENPTQEAVTKEPETETKETRKKETAAKAKAEKAPKAEKTATEEEKKEEDKTSDEEKKSE
eukprot:gnl/MRDRNA2_/MRDRNA2_91259_c0_seq1.p2 gnl/MRDRNA2_/MRDRNA2_91259_c0~~gnl/MRDRNA2_/MRDRNA2_91259_c0_seq1.p2  ORF type:complete len:228 (+),score=45.13 gnl/MRDRNA2_/MRDRNA2_91259_c0_seq1:922-1605(+)